MQQKVILCAEYVIIFRLADLTDLVFDWKDLCVIIYYLK